MSLAFEAPSAAEVECDLLLDPAGVFRDAGLRWSGGGWTRWSVGAPTARQGAYVAPALPVDIHCHGLGDFDFSSMAPEDLPGIEQRARAEGIHCVLTLFLHHARFDRTLELLRAYDALVRAGEVTHVLGFALEGPMLGNRGGTPEGTQWQPSRAEWQALAGCAPLGLRYVVVAPDAPAGEGPPMDWILSTLAEAGVRPALGHFRPDAPAESAASVQRAIRTVQGVNGGSWPLLTDHLFNDMPRRFTHAWRTPAERARRGDEVALFQETRWEWDGLDASVGEVPAALMRGAREGSLMLFLNFDGEHVDAEVSRRVVDFVGADRVIGMTDRVEGRSLAGEPLEPAEGSTLLYQRDGVVAAGSQGLDRQMRNLRRLGVDEASIWRMFSFLPLEALGRPVQAEGGPAGPVSYVEADGSRRVLEPAAGGAPA